MTLFGDAFQICKHIFRQCVQLDPLTLQLVAALVQTRELDDVIDQLQKAARLAVDVGGAVNTLTTDRDIGAADPVLHLQTNKSGGFAAGGNLCEVSKQKPA